MVVWKNQSITRTGSASAKLAGQASNAIQTVASDLILPYHETSR